MPEVNSVITPRGLFPVQMEKTVILVIITCNITQSITFALCFPELITSVERCQNQFVWMQILMRDYFQARCVELSDELYNDCKGTEHELIGSAAVKYAQNHQVGIWRNSLIGQTSWIFLYRSFHSNGLFSYPWKHQ